MIDYHRLLEEVMPVVRSTSDFIASQLNQVSTDDIEEKELNSLVSYVDKEAEKMLVSGLEALLPDSGFVTEEDTIDAKGKQFTWIIDPLDGTTNFLHQVPHFAISVALQQDSNTVIGIVKEVNSGEEWTAIRGNGAHLNGESIQVSTKPFSQILVATGFPYSNDHDYEAYFLILRHWLTGTRGVRRLGSAALDLCYVACGRYGAYYESTLNAWDVAAGALIVQEAGGIVSDYSGQEDYLYGGEIVSASPTVYDNVLTIIQKCLKKE